MVKLKPFLFLLLFFLTSDPVKTSKGLFPAGALPLSMAIPPEDTTGHHPQAWETFVPGPRSPSQLHRRFLEEESPEAASKNHYSTSLLSACYIKHLHAALQGTLAKHFNQF